MAMECSFQLGQKSLDNCMPQRLDQKSVRLQIGRPNRHAFTTNRNSFPDCGPALHDSEALRVLLEARKENRSDCPLPRKAGGHNVVSPGLKGVA